MQFVSFTCFNRVWQGLPPRQLPGACVDQKVQDIHSSGPGAGMRILLWRTPAVEPYIQTVDDWTSPITRTRVIWIQKY